MMHNLCWIISLDCLLIRLSYIEREVNEIFPWMKLFDRQWIYHIRSISFWNNVFFKVNCILSPRKRAMHRLKPNISETDEFTLLQFIDFVFPNEINHSRQEHDLVGVLHCVNRCVHLGRGELGMRISWQQWHGISSTCMWTNRLDYLVITN